ncbi:MAG: lactate utilization protein C [Candidatus Thiodiazotropha sp.]|jgi:L-lactate dehydrogenase complex protein LldG
MNESRERVLQRLRKNRPTPSVSPPVYHKPLHWNREQRIAAFTERMQAVRGEVHRVSRNDWLDWLVRELPQRGLKRVLVGTGSTGKAIAAKPMPDLKIICYDRPVDEWKSVLFDEVDVAVTEAQAGLAESGSLVLWPDTQEPRLMSLVPPVHIALLETDRLFENFAELIDKEHWTAGLPSNALLISGPSKTADIEQTLAYGIHGPKQLLTLLLE